MRISFSPQRRDDALNLERVDALKLSINGDLLDLSSVPTGATVEGARDLHPMLTGDIEMTDEGPHVTVILPHGPNPSPVLAFPADIVDPPLGAIVLPTMQQEG